MAAIIKIHLQCDVCGVEFGKDNPQTRAYLIKEIAKKEGWTFNSNVDLCGGCHGKIVKKYNYNRETNSNSNKYKRVKAALGSHEGDKT